jgi:hypothetical protein
LTKWALHEFWNLKHAIFCNWNFYYLLLPQYFNIKSYQFINLTSGQANFIKHEHCLGFDFDLAAYFVANIDTIASSVLHLFDSKSKSFNWYYSIRFDSKNHLIDWILIIHCLEKDLAALEMKDSIDFIINFAIAKS